MFDLDIASANVKALVAAFHCPVCGNAVGKRLRYFCGHIACDTCVLNSKYCYICLAQSEPVLDYNLSDQVKVVNEILGSFQVTFGVDVFQRPRLSEQLKIEKELFPQCIQAVHKYSNKRKSNEVITHKKTSPIVYPGENTDFSKIIKMDKSKQFVQNWLDQSNKLPSNKRKPFTDLDVNTIRFDSKLAKKTQDSIKSPNKTKMYNTTRSYSDNKDKYPFKLRSNLDKQKYVSKKIDLSSNWNESQKNSQSVIVIEDSQNEVVDKDLKAWQAVVQAHNDELTEMESQSVINLKCDEQIKYTDEVDKYCSQDNKSTLPTQNTREMFKLKTNYIPFFKKSKLLETCDKCLEWHKTHTLTQNKTFHKNIGNPSISITIVQKKSMTVMRVQNNCARLVSVESKAVQTDVIHDMQQKITNENTISKLPEGSEDFFASCNKDEVILVERKPAISDTGSDSNDEQCKQMIVTALIHHPLDDDNRQRQILGEIKQTRTVKPIKRRYTPNSSDSSEKENRDPNSRKRILTGKKKKNKC